MTFNTKRFLISAGGLVLVALLFLAVNIVANATLSGTRIDLTSDKLYTLSPGTRSVLTKIAEPITLRFYYSERLGKEIPSYGVYASRIREILEEYRNAAGGKIRLQVIDPQPFTDEEDRAVGFGLQGVPINQSGELIYFGLAGVNSADKEEVIPFFQPERERFLEVDLTKLIFNLSGVKKPAVGLMTTLPLQGAFRGPRQASEPWVIYTQMQQFFDVRMVDRDAAEIPADVGVLVLVHPQGLPDKTLFAIDQFVLRGGRALVFVDPHAEGELSRPSMAQQTGQTGSSLKKLFDAWGVEMAEDKVVGDRLSARRVNAGTSQRVQAIDYVLWLNLREERLNRSDVLTAEIAGIQMASAGSLKPKDGATTTFTPLIQTSDQAMQIDVEPIKMAPDPVGLYNNFKSENTRFTLAARVAGKVKTAFPEGKPVEPKPAEGEQPKDPAAATPPAPATPAAPALTESSGSVNLVIVADTDMLEDRFWTNVQEFFGQRVAVPFANNGDFVINAIDNLSGSDDLIGLRSRGQAARPFMRVQAIQREAEQRFRAKERELTEKLRDTEKKLSELQSQSQEQGAGKVIMSKAQQETIEQFRGDMLNTRRALRDVQYELRKDIESLEARLKFINIGLIPLLVAGAAGAVGVMRMRRRRPSDTAGRS
jgi:ABC-type uncharacterized transport system involved in gliding motility auxiliary subunit